MDRATGEYLICQLEAAVRTLYQFGPRQFEGRQQDITQAATLLNTFSRMVLSNMTHLRTSTTPHRPLPRRMVQLYGQFSAFLATGDDTLLGMLHSEFEHRANTATAHHCFVCNQVGHQPKDRFACEVKPDTKQPSNKFRQDRPQYPNRRRGNDQGDRHRQDRRRSRSRSRSPPDYNKNGAKRRNRKNG